MIKKSQNFRTYKIKLQTYHEPWVFFFNLIYYREGVWVKEEENPKKKLRTTDQPNKNLIHLHV